MPAWENETTSEGGGGTCSKKKYDDEERLVSFFGEERQQGLIKYYAVTHIRDDRIQLVSSINDRLRRRPAARRVAELAR